MKDLKKIDLQETEEQLDDQEVERIGGKNPSKLGESNTCPHRREDHKEENKIVLSKHCQGSSFNKIVSLYDIFLTGSNQWFQIDSHKTARYIPFSLP